MFSKFLLIIHNCSRTSCLNFNLSRMIIPSITVCNINLTLCFDRRSIEWTIYFSHIFWSIYILFCSICRTLAVRFGYQFQLTMHLTVPLLCLPQTVATLLETLEVLNKVVALFFCFNFVYHKNRIGFHHQ